MVFTRFSTPLFVVLSISLWLLSLSACRKTPAGPEPIIEVKTVSKVFLKQNGQDSLYLTLGFEDAEGDLGSESVDNILVSDGRTGNLLASYRIPNYLNDQNAYRKGEITLVVYSGCCIYSDSTSCRPNPAVSTDTMKYQIKIRDQAGNWSNEVLSPNIVLECN
jgi:hypothetical protein